MSSKTKSIVTRLIPFSSLWYNHSSLTGGQFLTLWLCSLPMLHALRGHTLLFSGKVDALTSPSYLSSLLHSIPPSSLGSSPPLQWNWSILLVDNKLFHMFFYISCDNYSNCSVQKRHWSYGWNSVRSCHCRHARVHFPPPPCVLAAPAPETSLHKYTGATEVLPCDA